MSQYVSDIAFTRSVKAAQDRLGSRASYAKSAARHDWSFEITPDLAGFVAERDSFFFGTASTDGRPYIQHRGGPKGFLKVLDDRTLAFADYGGNRQYISVGNLAENDQAFIFLMDWRNRRRVKIWGRAEFVDNGETLLGQVADPAYSGRPERVLRFHVEAWDINCPQHITPLFTKEEMGTAVGDLERRISELEAENRELRNQLPHTQLN